MCACLLKLVPKRNCFAGGGGAAEAGRVSARARQQVTLAAVRLRISFRPGQTLGRFMKLSPDQLEAELLQLPSHLRARLAGALLASLDELDSELDLAWADEADRRAAELETGRVTGIPAADARAAARSRLR